MTGTASVTVVVAESCLDRPLHDGLDRLGGGHHLRGEAVNAGHVDGWLGRRQAVDQPFHRLARGGTRTLLLDRLGVGRLDDRGFLRLGFVYLIYLGGSGSLLCCDLLAGEGPAGAHGDSAFRGASQR